MMRGDPVLERIRTADPSPASSPEPDVVLTDLELRSLINERIGPMSNDLQTDRPQQVSGTVHRRWGVAIASAGAVLVIGLLVVLVEFGMAPEETIEPATELPPDPVLVESFIDSWNTGAHAQALSAMGTDLTVNGEPWTNIEWQSYMEYTQAIGMTIDAECTQATLNVRCDMTQVGPFVHEPSEGSAGTIAFSMVDGEIRGIAMPRTDTAEDRLARFAKEASPSGYDQACAQAEGAHWDGLFDTTPVTFNSRCGTYIATHIGAFVEGEAGVRAVEAYFDAWNAGEIAAAQLLQADNLMVNSTVAGENWTNFMEFAVAFGGEHEVGCEASSFGTVCEWIWHTEFVEAQAIDNVGADGIRFAVTDGLITSFRTPSYGAFEAPFAAFVRSTDPDGYDVSCASDGISIVGTTGLVFNLPCGEFLASHVDAFIADLGS